MTCKNDNKVESYNKSIYREVNVDSDTKNSEIDNFNPNSFELMELGENLASDLEIKKFGIKKINDSISEFIFVLEENISAETVLKYSVGVRAYSSNLERPLTSSFAPNLSMYQGENCIRLKKNLQGIEYIDSLDIYSYKRKNWKTSGRLGSIIVRDIIIR